MPNDQVRLLLVEDVPQVAQYVRGLLNSQTQVRLVDVVTDGSRALTQLGELRPDVVVVDALLQGRVRGLALVKQLHASGLGIPVVVLTVPQQPVVVSPDEGIHDVISMPFNGYDLLTKVVGIHKARSAAGAASGCRMVTVFAPKGGVGKTTLAYNLAVASAGLGTRVVLVDGSIQFADLRAMLNVPESALSMLDLPTDRVSEGDLDDVLWHDSAGVDILLGPPRVEMAEMVLARDLQKTLSLLRRLYELIIVDTGVALDELTLSLLDQADTILQIVTYDGTTIHNTVAMAETFEKIGYPSSKIRYLVNRADASAGIDPAELDVKLGREPDFRVRSDGPVVGPASNRGEAFVTSNPDALVSRDVLEIARRLSPAPSANARAAMPARAAAAVAG